MVTQDAAIIPQVPKVKMKKVKKKSKKKKMKVANNLDSDSEADKLDLDQKIYTLSHYISDQEELVNQMFLTISGSKLEAMLPPVLKSTPLTELKRLCLHELRGMSKKRILCSINGEVMEGSSGSEDEEDDKEETAAEGSKQNDASTKGEKRKPGDDQAPESYLLKKIKVEPGLEDSTGSGEGKSVLELLELEMRARIIKTMLEKGDEGKKITEDAIAAVMQSAKQITKEGGDATGRGSKEAANAGAESKEDSQEKDADREAASKEEAAEGRSRGRRRSQGRRDRRRRHRPAGDGKRNSSRSQKRGDGSYSDEGSCGRSSKKQKEPSSPEKHVTKKKKITRKEFEERMKRAKKNRTYRQRKSSEDEEKTKVDEDKAEENSKENSEEKTEDKPDAKTQAAITEGKVTQDKAEGEASEKEEGEIDSNEEEEGACSPTDISSASRYSSSSSYSRSHSRSYSKSLSRSPCRGRQRSRRSRSRSRRRRRSYSRSYSRSRSPEKRKGRVEYQKRSYERKRSREPLRSSSKKDIKRSSPAEDRSPSREEDWGHKCDIEFVDSEEDFDDNPEATKKDAGGQKTVPVNRIERASISFSLQKKPVGIAQSVDLDDLPLKKKQVAEGVEALSPVKPSTTNEEIVISSDSEVELQGSTQDTAGKQKSSKELKPDSKEQTEKHPVTSIISSRLGGAQQTDTASIIGNMESQANQERIVQKAGDYETKIEAVAKGLQEESTEDSSKLATDTICEIHTEEGVKNIDKADSKEESHTRDSKVSSKDMDGSESTSVDTGDAPENVERENRDISPDSKHDDKSESSRTETTAVSDGSEADSKEKGSDSLCEKEDQDDSATKTHISGVDVKTDDNSLNETEMTKSSLKRPPKRRTEMAVNLKHSTGMHLVEEGGPTEAEATVSNETKSQICIDVAMESKDEGSPVDSGKEEKVEKSDSSVSREQMEEVDKKEVTTVFGDQAAEDDYEGTKQLKFSRDEKESEGRVFRELRKRRTRVEPIRLETGLIRRRVQPSRKIEMIVPEKSWMKREKKKKEKTKDVLAMEGIGLLKSTLSEGAQTSSQESELETERSQSIKLVEVSEKTEVPVKPVSSPVQVSDTENSQPLQDIGAQKLASPSPKRDTSPETSQTEDKSIKKIEHDTEIIGVIETSKDPSDNFEDMDLGGSSWSMRWLQSEKVQKVVTSSKMLSRVRKKIQKKEKATKVVMAEKVEEAQKPAEPVVSVIGSIEEYERLFGTKVKKDEAAAAAAGSAPQESLGQGQAPGSSAQSQCDIPEVKDKGNPVFGSDDDGEDSEEEALWSKIIKK